MDLQELRQRFGIKDVLAFDEVNGLVRLKVTAPASTGTLMLQGAHLTAWQPRGEAPVIFLSRKSEMAPGKPIRGGVPIVFPWFATDSKPDRIDGHPGPSHGFARIADWTLDEAKLADGAITLRLSLGPTALSRSMGFDGFRLTLSVSLGAKLEMELAVENSGSSAFEFEQAFHSYFDIEDIHEVAVDGLEPTTYIDKMDERRVKLAAGSAIRFTGPVDRVYESTVAPLTIHAGVQRRTIRVAKRDSHTTVVWNPGKAMPDLGEWDWHEMVAVEVANVGVNRRTIQPGETLRMGQTVTVARVPR